LYVPLFQQPEKRVSVLIHHQDIASATLVRAIQDAVGRVSADLPIFQVRTLQQQVDRSLSGERLASAAVSAAGVLGLAVGLLGLYGMMAFSVSQRRKEFGIRLSLGALPREPIRLVLRDAVALSAIGIGAGALAAWVLGHLFAGFLFETSAHDATTYVGVALLLGVTSLAASVWTARRVSALDPAEVLRAQ
jgi:ABC-type antimicrobial peptide transport system permease subunit